MGETHKKRILIDFSQIPIQKTGVGVYAYNLIRAIVKEDPHGEYFVLVQDDDPSLEEFNRPNVTLLKIRGKWFRNFFFRCLLEQLYLPYLALKHRLDAIHSLHYSFPALAPSRKIVTIHDLTFYKFPDMHVRPKIYYFRFFIRLSSRLADALICVSEATKRDYIRYSKYGGEKIYTIYHGVSDSFKEPPHPERIGAVKRRYGIEGEYILFIGTIEPRKNVKNIILAYERLRQKGIDLQLVIVGKKGWHYEEIFHTIEACNKSGRIVLPGFIQENEKKPLIDGAKLFIYPSMYEGFGIPVLEALACGIPTVTSNVSSMPEVAGNSALLIDPESVDDLFQAMYRLLTDDRLYHDLKSRSLDQAAKFDWGIAAAETIKIYESS